jgi:dihydrolipoamide dehydrogenase
VVAVDKRKVEVAIIGAGTAGMAAYRAVQKQKKSVVLIEGGPYGTTCARVGCMPSKLLVAAADSAHHLRKAPMFGVHPGKVEVNGKEVMDRVRRERDRFVSFVVEAVEGFPEEERLRGQARFLSPHKLVVGNEVEVEADRVVIATGSRPNIPGFLKDAKDRLVVNDDIFDWDDLPQSVAVFGPGIIGIELGQALSRLGVRVRMFGVSGSLGPIQDDDIRKYALKTFNDEFPLMASATVHSVARTDAGISVRFDDPEKGEVTETFDYLLAATGRRPNVDGMDLQNADIPLDERGAPIFDPYTMRCGDSHVFIAGDANNALPLLHEAADEGKIAGANAANYSEVLAGKRRVPLAIVFTDPQIATVGLSLNQLNERYKGGYAVGKVSFEGQGRSRVIGANKGMLHLYGEHGSGLFLGAEMFGPAAEHIGHLLAWAAQNRMTVGEMIDMPFYHPVIEEGLRSALRDLNRQLSIGPAPVERCLDCGPGG